MFQLLLKDIPNRLITKIAYASFYAPSRNERKVLALTTDFHLYELERKEIVFDCDLSCSAIQDTSLPQFSFEQPNNASGADGSSSSQSSDAESEIVQFGKYFSYTATTKRLFLLVKSFDKLIAVERTSRGFRFAKEFVKVERFEIVDPDNSFRARVAIYLEGELEPLMEAFVHDAGKDNSPRSVCAEATDETLRSVNDNIIEAKAELAVHELTTSRMFVSLKDRLMFGPNQFRIDRIEEKQPLGKYGDIWMKVCGDILVIGIPVINNCSRRLTVLQNIRPVIVCPDKDAIEFEYDLYHLNDDSYTFDNLDELLNSKEDRSDQLTFTKEWYPIKNKVLRPETSGVLVLQTQLNSLLNTTACKFCAHCFILYDIISDKMISNLQYYVKTIEIDTDILCFPEYRVTCGSKGIYKDLLAISATSKLFRWDMESKSDSIDQKLSTVLINTLGFSRLNYNDEKPDKMDIDEQFGDFTGFDDIPDKATVDRTHTQRKKNFDMYYHVSNEHNHLMGTLIRIEYLPAKIHLKVYVRQDYKALYIFDKIYRDFEADCTFLPTNYNFESCNQNLNIQNLEESLRKEIQMAIENIKNFGKKKKLLRSELYEAQIKLYAQELQTDILCANAKYS